MKLLKRILTIKFKPKIHFKFKSIIYILQIKSYFPNQKVLINKNKTRKMYSFAFLVTYSKSLTFINVYVKFKVNTKKKKVLQLKHLSNKT